MDSWGVEPLGSALSDETDLAANLAYMGPAILEVGGVDWGKAAIFGRNFVSDLGDVTAAITNMAGMGVDFISALPIFDISDEKMEDIRYAERPITNLDKWQGWFGHRAGNLVQDRWNEAVVRDDEGLDLLQMFGFQIGAIAAFMFTRFLYRRDRSDVKDSNLKQGWGSRLVPALVRAYRHRRLESAIEDGYTVLDKRLKKGLKTGGINRLTNRDKLLHDNIDDNEVLIRKGLGAIARDRRPIR